MRKIALLIDVAVRLFALGLFMRVVLTWVQLKPANPVVKYLDRIYNPLLAPLRKVVKPISLKTNPPSALDITPLLLLLMIWGFVHPFLMWVFSY